MIPWEIKAESITNCNCDFGCPCQFNALPTYGNCEAAVAFCIGTGHFDTVSLDGLRVAMAAWWPGPIHEGGGKALIVVDERANEEQRQGLLTVLSGGETKPGATIWNVFSATFDEVFDPVFKPIEFEIDIENRVGKANVDGLISINGEPIRNPITGEQHRAQIHLADGFEYEVAEIGSGSSKTLGPVELEIADKHCQFNRIHMNNNGIVRI
jgi:hypothetical protein